MKNAVIATALCYIVFTSPTCQGRMHDKTIAESCYTIPEGCELWQDGGYQGYRPQGVTVVQPQKKPKGKELTAAQKESNRQISRFRVRIEHVIGSVKRCRIVKEPCRLHKNCFVETVFRTCAGLHNLRLDLKPWKYNNYST